jgi:hypothetical protein
MEKEILISVIRAISWVFISLILIAMLQKIIVNLTIWSIKRKKAVSFRKN